MLMLLLPLAGQCETVTNIDIWDFPRRLDANDKSSSFRWIERMIHEFEGKNPGVKINLTKLSWKRGNEKLKIAALGGRNPDIAPGTIPLLFIRENLIEPIDDYLDKKDLEDYIRPALDAFRKSGKIYGWPWYMGGQLLFVNETFFKKAGVELPKDGHWTPDEFTAKMAAIRRCLPDSATHYPLGMYFQKDETANFPFIHAFGGEWFGENLEWLGSGDKTAKALTWLQELAECGIIPPDSGGRTVSDIWTAFAKEKRMAAAAFGLWGIGPLKADPETIFTPVHFPYAERKGSGPYLGISGYYIFRNPDKSRIQTAMKFAKFLTSTACQKDLKHYNQFPTRNSAIDIYNDDQTMMKAWKILKLGRTVPADARWPQIDEEIEIAIQNTLLGKATAPKAMATAENRIKGILSRSTGAISEDMNQSSIIGIIFLVMFPPTLLFMIFTRQVHLLMIIPAVMVLAIFLYMPLADSLVLAFRDYRFGEVGNFTLSNFHRAITDPKFIKAFKNTFLYAAVVVPVNVFTALAAATLIFSLPAFLKRFFRAAYYLPGVASVVVLSMVWRWIFNTELGLFNSVLTYAGAGPIGWLTDPDIAFGSIILTGILRSPGGAILIYLAALSNVPVSIYESAELDGASSMQKWLYITVPLVRGTTLFLITTGTIDALQVFAQVMMLTDGGPGISTEVVVHRIYTAAFRDFDFGLSSAMALMLFIIIMVWTLIQRKIGGIETEQYA